MSKGKVSCKFTATFMQMTRRSSYLCVFLRYLASMPSRRKILICEFKRIPRIHDTLRDLLRELAKYLSLNGGGICTFFQFPQVASLKYSHGELALTALRTLLLRCESRNSILLVHDYNAQCNYSP